MKKLIAETAGDFLKKHMGKPVDKEMIDALVPYLFLREKRWKREIIQQCQEVFRSNRP